MEYQVGKRYKIVKLDEFEWPDTISHINTQDMTFVVDSVQPLTNAAFSKGMCTATQEELERGIVVLSDEGDNSDEFYVVLGRTFYTFEEAKEHAESRDADTILVAKITKALHKDWC